MITAARPSSDDFVEDSPARRPAARPPAARPTPPAKTRIPPKAVQEKKKPNEKKLEMDRVNLYKDYINGLASWGVTKEMLSQPM